MNNGSSVIDAATGWKLTFATKKLLNFQQQLSATPDKTQLFAGLLNFRLNFSLSSKFNNER